MTLDVLPDRIDLIYSLIDLMYGQIYSFYYLIDLIYYQIDSFYYLIDLIYYLIDLIYYPSALWSFSVREWRAKWHLAGQFADASYDDIIRDMADIQPHVRLKAIATVGKAAEYRPPSDPGIQIGSHGVLTDPLAVRHQR